MDKKSILKAISLILAAIAVLGFVGYFTIKDTGGFIDLSGIAKAVDMIIVFVCGVLAFILWNISKGSD
jgi:hypothetical protein